MDAVWVYINSTDQGELKESLRLSRNVEHDKNFVIGDKPLFDNDAIHLKPPIVRWAMLSPHHDVCNKLNFAANCVDISEDFILFNDDFFITRSTEIKPHHRGTLDEHIASRFRNDAYTKSLVKTNDYLKRIGIQNPLSYELHIPMIFNKEKLAELYKQIIPEIMYNSPLLTRSLYGNMYKVGGTKMADPKNPTDYKGKLFLSTNEKTFAGELGDYIRGIK